jgi:hypothetical protein
MLMAVLKDSSVKLTSDVAKLSAEKPAQIETHAALHASPPSHSSLAVTLTTPSPHVLVVQSALQVADSPASSQTSSPSTTPSPHTAVDPVEVLSSAAPVDSASVVEPDVLLDVSPVVLGSAEVLDVLGSGVSPVVLGSGSGGRSPEDEPDVPLVLPAIGSSPESSLGQAVRRRTPAAQRGRKTVFNTQKP